MFFFTYIRIETLNYTAAQHFPVGFCRKKYSIHSYTCIPACVRILLQQVARLRRVVFVLVLSIRT